MQSGDVKKRLAEVLTEIVERHRKARAAVTDEVKNSLFSSNYIQYQGLIKYLTLTEFLQPTNFRWWMLSWT